MRSLHLPYSVMRETHLISKNFVLYEVHEINA